MIINIPITGAGEEIEIDVLDEYMTQLFSTKEKHTAIRQQFDYIEDIFEEDELRAEEITSNPALMWYVMEYETGIDCDTMRRDLDSEVMQYFLKSHLFEKEGEEDSLLLQDWTDELKELESWYPLIFVLPSIFTDALLNSETLAPIATSSPVLMEAIMESDESDINYIINL